MYERYIQQKVSRTLVVAVSMSAILVILHTCRGRNEGWFLLEVAISVQEVPKVKGPGIPPLALIPEHGVQHGKDHCVLQGVKGHGSGSV